MLVVSVNLPAAAYFKRQGIVGMSLAVGRLKPMSTLHQRDEDIPDGVNRGQIAAIELQAGLAVGAISPGGLN